MTYRLRNVLVAVALALVAALLTSFYVTNYQRNVTRDETNVEVFVAKNDIPVGTSGADLARKGLLEKSEIVRRTVVPGAISSPDQLAELVAVQPVYAGEQVSTRRFATPAERGVRAQLKGTMRAIQVPGDSHQLLSGTLRAGDRIDIVASIKLGQDESAFATRIVLRDIEVLKAAVGGGDGTPKLAATDGDLSVLLAVTDTQVQKLFHVLKHGEWSFELRPPLKSNDSPEAVAYAGSILTDGLRGAQLERIQSGGTR
ncbi:MAG: Flp pilus assembly protein CpaB [Actinobacteria bacterium]|nr:Flp pilus assembly protein CpaB [Actinomycetota bacterium]